MLPDALVRRRSRPLARVTPARLALAAVAALVVAPPLAAATLTVDVATDGHDETPGDGACDVGAGGGHHCTLRAAIEEAEALAGADTILFAAGTDGTPITLDLGALPTVTTDLALTGNGAAATIVQASACNPVTLPGGCTPAGFRVLTIVWPATVQLTGMTLRHGRCAGACPNLANEGGGIRNASGTLSLSAVTIAGNRAEGQGGGGIANDGGILSIRGSLLSGNETDGNGGGIDNRAGTITSIRDSVVSDNQAGGNGGGIDATDPDGSIGSIVRTVFSGNSAVSGGGLSAGYLSVVASSIFSGNSASSTGGGFLATEEVDLVTDCTFDGNSAGSVGGGLATSIGNGVGLITRSVFSGNSSTTGGGVGLDGGDIGAIVDSTFSGNTASVQGGAINGDHAGETIGSLVHLTITGNSAPLGAGIHVADGAPLSGSILGANGAGANCAGTFTDAGGNRSDDSSCASGGAIAPGTDYSLTLAANGGNTKTHALPGGSVAIDDLGACPVALGGVDQRGAPRDGSCDTGAFEAVEGFLFADAFESGTDGVWSAAAP